MFSGWLYNHIVLLRASSHQPWSERVSDRASEWSSAANQMSAQWKRSNNHSATRFHRAVPASSSSVLFCMFTFKEKNKQSEQKAHLSRLMARLLWREKLRGLLLSHKCLPRLRSRKRWLLESSFGVSLSKSSTLKGDRREMDILIERSSLKDGLMRNSWEIRHDKIASEWTCTWAHVNIPLMNDESSRGIVYKCRLEMSNHQDEVLLELDCSGDDWRCRQNLWYLSIYYQVVLHYLHWPMLTLKQIHLLNLCEWFRQ